MRLYNYTEVPKNSVLEVFGSKRYFTKLYMYVIECVVLSMFEFTVNEATTSSYEDVWKVKAR